jgi:hypothetical protein
MANRSITIITPATNFDFLTLDEAKLLLGISEDTAESDAQLALQISIYSATIAKHCNDRTFAYETVQETWRSDVTLSSNRLFLSHWPVKQEDLTMVHAPRGSLVDPTTYELEEGSGKVELYGGMMEPIVVTYKGGYHLPTGAPLPLKQATLMLMREERTQAQQAQTAGIRSISHRDARVMFFDPNTAIGKAASSKGGGELPPAVAALLSGYTRIEV